MGDISPQLIEQVNTAKQNRVRLNIVGRGSKQFLGRTPVGETLSVAEHSGIVSYQPIELVITVRAGTLLKDIETILDEHDQMLAFEPPRFDGKASIGGTLACNLSGPSRPFRGGVRDMVLGARLINGKGQHLSFGGQVMKNVAGYDVSRLLAGAMGTLGIITEVSLKVVPKPTTNVTLVKTLDADQAIVTMNQLAGKFGALTAACWNQNKLYIRFSGADTAVKKAATQWPGDILDDGDQFWRELRDMRAGFFTTAPGALWRFSVKSTAAHFLSDADWLIDWGGALRWLRQGSIVNDVEREQLEHSAVAANGQVMVFRGGDPEKEVFHAQSDPAKVILQRLKAAFDPDGLFNPGRLYSWL